MKNIKCRNCIIYRNEWCKAVADSPDPDRVRDCAYFREKINTDGIRSQQSRPTMGKKCSFPDDVTIRPDGVNELDPCVYEEVERYRNVTVSVLRCPKCGHTEINWYRQEDTEEVELNVQQ